MAALQFNTTQLANAQLQVMSRLYDLYQNETVLWGELEKVPREEINFKGYQVVNEIHPNASLGYRSGNGDTLPVPQGPLWDNFTVTYVGLQAGTDQTYAAFLNNNSRVTANFRQVVESNARQFASILDTYATRGNGTQMMATVSAAYDGGSPTVAVCNGSTDSIGPSVLVPSGYYQVWNSAGTTLRNGTIGGAGIVQLASKTAANAIGATNWPSDMVATDIIVPATGGGSADASYGLYGLQHIIDSAGTYFGQNRSAVSGLASYEKAMGGNLTVAALAETYASMVDRGGYYGEELKDFLTIFMNSGNWNNYTSLALNSGAVVGSPNQFMHTNSGKPGLDFGYKSVKYTYFGAPVRVLPNAEGSEIYFLNFKMLKRAILKDVGNIAAGMPASDWLQGVNGDGNYLNSRARWMDFFGQVFSPQPFKLGKISGITLVAPTQKATRVLMNS